MNTKNHNGARGASIQKFTFDGDELDVVAGADGVLVVIRRVCEVLGVAYESQARKLKTDPSVGVIMMITPTPGGPQETACIDIRALPLWLATIHPSKVKPAVRPKLLVYKKECQEALADRFLGPRGVHSRDVAGILQRMETLEAKVQSAEVENATLLAKVELLDPDGPGVIGKPRAVKYILSNLREAARMYCASIGDYSERTFRREFNDRESQVRLHVDFPTCAAQRWENLPIDKFGKAMTKVLEIKEKDRRRAKEARAALQARVEQLELGGVH